MRQVVECVNAFKIDLPAELLAKVDEVHEQYRSPIMYMCSKEVCMQGTFLGRGARHAKTPDASPLRKYALPVCLGAVLALALAKAR